LDWNKKVAHILVTGSSAGFVTVWDVKTKKESLTLNNMGRKAVSAVAWDPEKVRLNKIMQQLILSLTLDSPRNSLLPHHWSPILLSTFGISAIPMPRKG
jgi:WD40 repeat protein